MAVDVAGDAADVAFGELGAGLGDGADGLTDCATDAEIAITAVISSAINETRNMTEQS